jgi:hypothetical protein
MRAFRSRRSSQVLMNAITGSFAAGRFFPGWLLPRGIQVITDAAPGYTKVFVIEVDLI